jgi:subtilase family serine protease
LFYLGAAIDPRNQTPEFNEANNTNSGYRIGIGSRPDFVVKSVTGPASVQPGQEVTAQVTVCNQGVVAGSTEVDLALSIDSTISWLADSLVPPDFSAGRASLPNLIPGECRIALVTFGAYVQMRDVSYFLGAVVDLDSRVLELNEGNNISSGYRLGVGYRPDFVIKSLSGPASAEVGQPISVQLVLCNQGTVDGWADAEVYLTADTVITTLASVPSTPDALVVHAPAALLAAGSCQTLTLTGYAYPPNGALGKYYLGAVVDPRDDQIEFQEQNNVKLGTVVTF